jgi:opacity protein-like surface antigen
MTGRTTRILCAVLLITGASTAQAQLLERGWTFELGMGKTTFDVQAADGDALTRDFFDSFELPVQSLTSTLDKKDKSFALFGGYRFNRWLAAEAGFFSLGAFRYTSSGTVDDVGTIRQASFNYRYRVKGMMLGGTATLPLGQYLEARVRAGFTTSSPKISYTATVDGEALSDSFSDSSQDFYYGAGVGLNLWEFYRIGLDFMHHGKVGKASTTGSTDVDNVMLSIGYRY